VDPNPGDRLAYAWSLDGQEVSRAETWRFAAPPASGARMPPRVVEVEVSDQDGLKAPRVAWNVEIKPSPPEIVDFEPRGRTVPVEAGRSAEFSVRTRARGGGGAVRHEWTIDGRPAGSVEGRFTLPSTLAPGNHEVSVAAVDARGLRSPAQRWRVEVAAVTPPAAAVPPKPSEPVAPEVSELSEAEARAWLERIRDAYQRKDAAALRALGILKNEEQERAFTQAMRRYKDYRVTISNPKIQPEGARATVSFDRSDADETGRVLPHPRQVYRLQKIDGKVVAGR
jgi:hypothetical protein